MKKIAIFTALILLCCFAYGKSVRYSGIVAEKQFKVLPPYSVISVDGDIEVHYSKECQRPTLKADKSVVDYISIGMKGNKLVIGYNVRTLNTRRPKGKVSIPAAVVTLPVNPSLVNISLEGTSCFSCDCPIASPKLFITESGCAYFCSQIETENLFVTMSGSATAELAGKARNTEITLSGASQYRAENLDAGSAKVTMSGAAVADVKSRECIKGELSGATRLKCYGNTDATKVSLAGAARIIGIR